MFLLKISLTPTDIAGYITGFLALVTFVLSFQMKNRKNLLILQSVSLVLFAIQYYLTGAYTGVILEGVCIARNVTYYFRNKHKFLDSIYIPIIFSTLAIIVGIFTYANWTSIIPVVANILQTIGLYIKRERDNRIFFLIGSPLWLTYNFINGVWFGVITEFLNIISIVVSIIRIVRIENKEKVTSAN